MPIIQSLVRQTVALGALLLATLAPAGEPLPRSGPVTPEALPETRALLELLYDIGGKHMLSGQHNYPLAEDRNSAFAADYIGNAPAVFSSDWGFSEDGDWDSYLARPAVVATAIRQHRLGALITICWHAVPPTADEPVPFRPRPGSDEAVLASVQGQLTDQQFLEVVTPGTALHERWAAQVDAIAVFLKQLEEARVPVLWRPYHEMNGDWFWWGGRRGEKGTADLYRQLFDRLVNHHQLKNLIWVWSVDRVSREEGMEHADYFPGIEYVDVLSLDVYGNDFSQSYYDSLVALSENKPLALAEVGNPPTREILDDQPLWTFYATWAGMVRNTLPRDYATLMKDPRVLNLDDPGYAEVTRAYREACGLPMLEIESKPADFSGTWTLNAAASEPGRMGFGFAPSRIEVTHADGTLTRRTTRIREYADPEISEEQLSLDGTEQETVGFRGAKGTIVGRLSADGRQLTTTSSFDSPFGPPGGTMTITQIWELLAGGRQLAVRQTASFGRGQETLLVFDRR